MDGSWRRPSHFIFMAKKIDVQKRNLILADDVDDDDVTDVLGEAACKRARSEALL